MKELKRFTHRFHNYLASSPCLWVGVFFALKRAVTAKEQKLHTLPEPLISFIVSKFTHFKFVAFTY